MTNIEREITIKTNEACQQYDDSANYRYGYYDGSKWMYDKMLEKVRELLEKTIDEDVAINCGNVIKIISKSEFIEYFTTCLEK